MAHAPMCMHARTPGLLASRVVYIFLRVLCVDYYAAEVLELTHNEHHLLPRTCAPAVAAGAEKVRETLAAAQSSAKKKRSKKKGQTYMGTVRACGRAGWCAWVGDAAGRRGGCCGWTTA